MAKQILTASEANALFLYDPITGELTHRTGKSAGKTAAKPAVQGYLRATVGRTEYRLHRLVWLMHTGAQCEQEIDHINRVKTDNRWANLRSVSRQQNAQNMPVRSDNTSGVPGVSWSKRASKWMAHIRVAGKRTHLGLFTTVEAATQARATAEKQMFTHSPLNTALPTTG